jgi:hypothetical protein
MNTAKAASDRIYSLLVEDEDARVCRDIPEEACAEQPLAFTTQLGAQILTKIGDALTSSRLVLAWMLGSIGAPAILISLLVPIRESLSLLPQLAIAQWVREHPVRKWFWVFGSLAQAAALLGMVAALLLLPAIQASYLIIVLLAAFSLSRGICSIAAKDVLGKTISKSRRGRLTGLAASSAGLVTLVVALLLWLFPSWSSGAAADASLFALILGTAALLWMAAAAIYACTPEVPGATEGGGNAATEALKSLRILKEDNAFRDFLVARALLVSTAFAIPYIVLLLQREGDGGIGDLAILLFAEGAAGLLSGHFWGRWSDQAAHGVMAVAATLSAAVIAACLLLSELSPSWLNSVVPGFVLIFCAAIAHHGVRVGRKTYLVDMATADNRAQLTAVSNTVMGVVLLLGAGLGVIDTLFGTSSVLGLLLVIALLAVVRSATLARVSG